MKKILAICLSFLLTISMAGCAADPQPPEPASPDYHAFFSSFGHAETRVRDLVIDQEYALVCYEGTGPSVRLFEFEAQGASLSVRASAAGELAVSGGLSINHTEKDGKHIYFGNLTDRHWDPAEDSAQNTGWTKLRMTSQSGTVCEVDAASESVYLCILDAPLQDFEAEGPEGVPFLTLEEYLSQGYSVAEITLTASASSPEDHGVSNAVDLCQFVKDCLAEPDSFQIHGVSHLETEGRHYYYLDFSHRIKNAELERTHYFAEFEGASLLCIVNARSSIYYQTDGDYTEKYAALSAMFQAEPARMLDVDRILSNLN